MSRPKQRTVCGVITSRASYARIKTVLLAIACDVRLSLITVVAASALLGRYGSVVEVMRRDGLEPDEIVYTSVEGGNLTTSAKSTGLALLELSTVFSRHSPDVVLTIADRYETIATAIAASYLNIPVAHMQGGEVTGSIDEKVRHAVTKLSNIHFCANHESADRVIRMGEDPDAVHVTGCPSIDLARIALEHLTADDVTRTADLGLVPTTDFLIVMQHPVTDEFDQAAVQIKETLFAIARLDVPTLWFLPNVDAGSEAIRTVLETSPEAKKLQFINSMPPEEFLGILLRCRCLVGNSSVGIREGSFLGVPTVNIGNRQSGRTRGANVIDVRYDRHEIEAAVRRQVDVRARERSNIYGDGYAGVRVADLLATASLRAEKRLAY
jgi:UDP-hydrolysing UDP-N-acetyl-D-glucosamine 2-epimerase